MNYDINSTYLVWSLCVFCHSRAILRYVADAYSNGSDLYPTEPQRRASIDRALDYDLATLYKHIGNFIVSNRTKCLQ